MTNSLLIWKHASQRVLLNVLENGIRFHLQSHQFYAKDKAKIPHYPSSSESKRIAQVFLKAVSATDIYMMPHKELLSPCTLMITGTVRMVGVLP